jgi:hypothetical protein
LKGNTHPFITPLSSSWDTNLPIVTTEGISMFVATACLVGLVFVVEAPDSIPTYTLDSRYFEIPIIVRESRLEEIDSLILYCSTDDGKTWKKVKTASPHKKSFTYRVPKDGTYWCI